MENENDNVVEEVATETDIQEEVEEKDYKAMFGSLKRENTKIQKELETTKSNPINNPDIFEKLEKLELSMALKDYGLDPNDQDIVDSVKKLGGVESLKNSVVLKVLTEEQKVKKAEQAASIETGSQGRVKGARLSDAEISKMPSEDYEEYLRKIGKA